MNITAHNHTDLYVQQHIIRKLEPHFITPAITVQECQPKTSVDLTTSLEIQFQGKLIMLYCSEIITNRVDKKGRTAVAATRKFEYLRGIIKSQ